MLKYNKHKKVGQVKGDWSTGWGLQIRCNLK